MNPNYGKMSLGELTAFVNRMVLAIGTADPNPFGVDPFLVSTLKNASLATTAAASVAGQRKDAYVASLRDRDAQADNAVDLVSTVTRLVLANSNLTPAQLASVGLSPRARSRPRIVPQAPAGLTTALLPTGDVRLAWTSSSPYGVVYRIEAQVGSEPWAFVDETTAKKIVLSGFVAGVPAAFRVVAAKNGAVSAPSPVATIYYAPAAPALRLAA